MELKQASSQGQQSTTDVSERRNGDRRRSADDRRFWRALMTERRVSERRRPQVQKPKRSVSAAQEPSTGSSAVSSSPSNKPRPSTRVVSRRAKAVPVAANVASGSSSPAKHAQPGELSSAKRGTAVGSDAKSRLDTRSAERLNTASTRGGGTTANDESTRRARLKSMLHAANERQARSSARRLRRPVMAAGIKVRVVGGSRARAQGTILDADYINGRALVELEDELNPVWISFRDLAAAGPSRSI